MKVRTNILIEKEILDKAKELGLNISKTCENLLKRYIQIIEQTNNQIFTINNTSQQNKTKQREGTETVGCRMAGGVGFEPTTTSLGGLRPILARLPAH